MSTAAQPRVRPWGAGRLAPYPAVTHRPDTAVTLDPATQLGVFTDHAGTVIEMGKHGTGKGTETSTTTNSDSAPDEGHDQDSEQD
ncbi:putative ATP-grasp-modified RiPP [Streptomyces sp. NPDC058417]|uniref:putative ATP-grasp-modified RiPP n=1 Tax=unclassified Streptomyces TaxID=2593676 RepID=UPI00364C7B52